MVHSTRRERDGPRARNNATMKKLRSIFNVIFFSLVFAVITFLSRIPENRYQVGNTIPVYTRSASSPINFVLFLGIEGTGHHFWQDLVRESPIFDQVHEYGLHPEYTRKLTESLYRHKKARWKGMWSAPCKWSESDPTPNTTAINEELVRTLEAMKNLVYSENKRRGDGVVKQVIFPVNFLATGDEFGVASYPGFLKPCRPLQYPNIDIWYEACDRAKVACSHVYIYRDPFAVIKSTTDNRSINKEKLEAIHLYTTHLHVIYAQLAIFSNRLAGCWDYDAVLSPDFQSKEIIPILNFPDQPSLNDAIQKVYHPKKVMTGNDKVVSVPAEFAAHMASMSRIHKRVVELCVTQRDGVS